MVKDLLEESLRMQIFEGNVRAYVDKPQTHFPLNEQGKLDVRRAVGTDGSIQVVKDVGMKDYFSGASPIVSGELEKTSHTILRQVNKHLHQLV